MYSKVFYQEFKECSAASTIPLGDYEQNEPGVLEGTPHRLLASYFGDATYEDGGVLKLQCVENGKWIYAYEDLLEGAFFLLGTDPATATANLHLNLQRLPKAK